MAAVISRSKAMNISQEGVLARSTWSLSTQLLPGQATRHDPEQKPASDLSSQQEAICHKLKMPKESSFEQYTYPEQM